MNKRDSIERGNAAHLDRVSILDESSRANLWEQFLRAFPVFEATRTPRGFEGQREAGGR